jgi:hypothetical protein
MCGFNILVTIGPLPAHKEAAGVGRGSTASGCGLSAEQTRSQTLKSDSEKGLVFIVSLRSVLEGYATNKQSLFRFS